MNSHLTYFLERARRAYGDEYDLSMVLEGRTNDRIVVGCPEHGAFEIGVSNFLYRAGCPQCRGRHPRGYPKPIAGLVPRARSTAMQGGYFYVVASRPGHIKVGCGPTLPVRDVVYHKYFNSAPTSQAIEAIVKDTFTPNGECGSRNLHRISAIVDVIQALIR